MDSWKNLHSHGMFQVLLDFPAFSWISGKVTQNSEKVGIPGICEFWLREMLTKGKVLYITVAGYWSLGHFMKVRVFEAVW